MAGPLIPPLHGIAQARFVSVGQQLRSNGEWLNDTILRQILERETAWAESPAARKELRNEVAAYRASISALIDLVRIGWRVDVARGTIELLPPARLRARLSPEQIRARKDDVRRNLRPLVAEQLNHPEFRRVVKRLESPVAKSKTRSITDLVTSGKELAARLSKAHKAPKNERSKLLSSAIQPYLQLVTEDKRDDTTGIRLSEIWRYFRATWAIPNLSIPGRSMLFLVRDAANPSHPVMGIIGLNNAPMRKRALDEWIGWTPGSLRMQLEEIRNGPSPKRRLAQMVDKFKSILASAASGICPDGLISSSDLKSPTGSASRRLITLGDQFESLREKVLKDIESQNKKSVARKKRVAPSYLSTANLPPLDDHLPDLDATPDPASLLARRLLVAKKRSHELSRLLQAQVTFNERREKLTDPATALHAWAEDSVMVALGVVCMTMKSARLGTNLLEITTCGAVAPYNAILGGKLAALMCFSPEVAASYQDRYGKESAIIRSHMANRLVPNDCRLAALVTTSLYGVGSSQYERLRLPAGTIAPKQTELRVAHIGESGGYGTVHFTGETTSEIESFVRQSKEYTDVNSVFGEGPSPKLRKLRTGLDLLGFSSDDLLKHHQTRLVYALEYWPGATEFLRYGTGDVPAWIEHPDRFRDTTEKIADFWRSRWLASRLDHDETWASLTANKDPWKLSALLPVSSKKNLPIPPIATELEQISLNEIGAPNVFQRLAERKNDLYSERLSESDLEKLHIETPLDAFVIETVKVGRSLVLTGNAGDGKTHLLRRLRGLLPANCVVIEDATAAMINGAAAPVLEKVREAIVGHRAFVLCANEHQLLKLCDGATRTRHTGLQAVFNEIKRQRRHRLVYGLEEPSEEAKEDVVVLDLSLRNPLASGFANRVIDKLLLDADVQQCAQIDASIARNIRRVANTQVRDRLVALLDRIVLHGERATVRQLWMIIASAIFAPNSSCSGDAPAAWYSEQLFGGKGLLEIDILLNRYADPANYSHPQWDWMLRESPNPESPPENWPVDGFPVGVNRSRDAKHWFNAIKRRFYFEHVRGDQLFSMEARSTQDFRALLRSGQVPDPAQIGPLLRGLNRLYCPPGFNGDDSALHLWQGLRYHEHPSRAYLSAGHVQREQFSLELPRPPSRVAKAFGQGSDCIFAPDHLQLIAVVENTRRVLKLDYSLYSVLLKVAEGLPRHLVPESQIHRVDAFIERIGASQAQYGTDFLLFNAEDGTVTKIATNSQRSRIESVSQIS